MSAGSLWADIIGDIGLLSDHADPETADRAASTLRKLARALAATTGLPQLEAARQLALSSARECERILADRRAESEQGA